MSYLTRCISWAFCFLFFTATGWSQIRVPATSGGKPNTSTAPQGARPGYGASADEVMTTPSGRPYMHRTDQPKGESVFYMSAPPTFADHSEEAKRIETEFPVMMPVVPIFNTSGKLPGYLDATRSVSFIMMDELLEELPPVYGDAFEMIDYHTEGKLSRSYNDDRLKFVYQKNWEWAEQNGRGRELVWEYTNEGETWMRHEMILGRWQEGGFHYINLMSFYPVRFKDRMRPELDHYFEQLIINDYER